MRLANLDGRATILTASGGIDVEEASQGRLPPSLPALYEVWADLVRHDFSGAESRPVDQSRLGAPSPAPRQVFAIGLNYRDHVEETGSRLPAAPAVFTKFPSCLTGPFAEIRLPSGHVDWEVELVLVVGREAHGVSEADAWDVLAGVTVGQDLSERVVQHASGGHFSLGKSYPGFGPTGPWLVTPDELPNRDDLRLSCSVDGETRQDGRTADMVFDSPRLVAELSSAVTLWPGDLIFTGTPAGVGFGRQPPLYLRPGQVLETTIEGIGTMRNRLC